MATVGDTAAFPVATPATVGVNPSVVLPYNGSRTCLVFFNPGPGAVAICPVNPPQSANPNLVPIIGGAGSVTLQANGTAIFDTLPCTAAWQAISQLPNAPLTILEA